MAPSEADLKMYDLMKALPKAELHLHLEGSLTPEMVFKLSERNGVQLPFNTLEELRESYKFTCLNDFIQAYNRGVVCLKTEEDYYDMCLDYLSKARADGVVHAEFAFNPHNALSKGLDYPSILRGLTRGREEAERSLGITSVLLASVQRHLPEQVAMEVFDTVLHPDHIGHVGGVSLAGAEVGNPPSKFERAFDRARAAGLKLCAHAGEEAGPDYVLEAIDVLKVDRVDHGVQSMKDPELVERLARDQIPLTVCPLSNQKLQVFPDLKDLPLRTMLEKGICALVNSDDPPYFGGGVQDNFVATYHALDLTPQEVYKLCRNSFQAAWISDEARQGHYDSLDAAFAASGLGDAAGEKGP